MTRPTMGTSASAVTPVGPDPAHTTLVAKNNGKSDAPDSRGGVRPGVLEVNGFKGAPQVNYCYPNSPESAANTRNVRLMPSAKGNTDFYAARAQTGQPLI